jgi:mannose-6-phosphate isomerase-like protein (cupin superfamily)
VHCDIPVWIARFRDVRSCIAILVLTALPGHGAKIWDVLKSADVDSMFANTRQSLDVLVKPNYSVVFRVSSGSPSPWQTHPDADELWFVRHGSAKLTLGNFTRMLGVQRTGEEFSLGAGDVVNLPRTKAYEIQPGAGRFEYVAVRVFPENRHTPPVGSGSGREPAPMPTVVSASQIDAKFASAEKNERLHAVGAVLVNYILAPPSWPQPPIPESHMTCDDFYYIRLGGARAEVDGYITGPVEKPAGEIHGKTAVGARAYSVSPGDLLSIPRNTMHEMEPTSARFGYLLVKICD